VAFFVEVVPCTLWLAVLFTVGLEIRNGVGLGLFRVHSLEGDPALHDLIQHTREQYPQMWMYLFGLIEENPWHLSRLHLAMGILLAWCVLAIVLVLALVTRRPFRGSPPTAADLEQEVLSGGWPDAPESELRELRRLRPCQVLALSHVRRISGKLHAEAMPRLRRRVAELGFRSEDLDLALAWIREQAPIVIHLKLERCAAQLSEDSHYRNQFQICGSGGTYDNRSRMAWEDDLFGCAYRGAAPFERCKYGSMNVINDPHGVRKCAQYGSSYLLLRGARLRTTFSAQDSAGLDARDLATVDYYGHVFLKYSDDELRGALMVAKMQGSAGIDSRVLSSYKEAQVHGEVRLCEHVEIIVAHPCMQQTPHRLDSLRALERRCRAQSVWIETGDASEPRDAPRASSGEPLARDAGSPASAGAGGAARPRRSSDGVEDLALAAYGDPGQAGFELLVVIRGALGPHAARINGSYCASAGRPVFTKCGGGARLSPRARRARRAGRSWAPPPRTSRPFSRRTAARGCAPTSPRGTPRARPTGR